MIIKENQWIISLLLIVIFVLLFRLISLSVLDLNLAFDEAQYWTWSLNNEWGYYSKPPLLAWLLSLTTSSCGISEFCIRIISPILYSISAFFIAFSAYLLSDATHRKRAAFLAGSIWIIIPGISFSSGIISTDVPMLFFSSLIIWCLCYCLFSDKKKYKNLFWAVLTVSFALGFLSKYAIILIPVSFLFFIILNKNFFKEYLVRLNKKKILFFLSIFILIIYPHILWNFENGFITFQHTADNANIRGTSYSFYNAFIFFLEQFAVFGPINFIILLYLAFRYQKLPSKQKLILFLSITPILIMVIQAFFSRAHANWAVVSYVPATILIALFLANWSKKEQKAYYISIFTSLVVLFSLPVFAYLNFKLDPFKKMRGWQEVVINISEIYSHYPNAVLVADDRKILAESIYYLKPRPIQWVRWNTDGKIHDHYELVTKHKDLKNKISIMVSVEEDNKHFEKFFDKVRYLGAVSRKIREGKTKEYKLWLLEGYKE